MSFGEGNLHDEVDRLKVVNGKLCDEINRQERVIEELREKETAYMDANHEQGMQLIEQDKRIRELESLVREWWELYENPDYGDCCRLTRRMSELGIEVD